MIHRRYAAGLAAGVLALAVAVGPVEAQQQGSVRVPRSVLERYEGEYDQNGSTVMIRLYGDTLFREIPGQRVALRPMSETLFRMAGAFTAEFVTDEGGGVTLFVRSGVIEFRLPRKGRRPAPPPPLPLATVPVPRSVLERYVGVYEYIPGQMDRTDLRVVVRLKGDTLIRVIAGEQVLTPISETLFRVAGTALVTEFVVDEAGVTQVMGLGFQQLLARLKPKR